jgi:hypothetical protein
MSIFVQSLERRLFLSGSGGGPLADDYGQVIADAAAANGALKALGAEFRTSGGAIAVDLRTLPKANIKLLAKLKTDEAATNRELTTDLGSLLKPAMALSRKSASVGEALASKSSEAIINEATADSDALGNITSVPEETLTAVLGSTTVTSDLNALGVANSSDVALARDVATAEGDVTAQDNAINDAAGEFVVDTSDLSVDLSSEISQAPSGASGDFISELANSEPELFGGATYTRGSNPWGSEDNLHIEINAVNSAGDITGNLSGGFATDFVARSLVDAKVTSSGKFSAKLPTSIVDIATISGQFSMDQYGNVTLNGTFKDTDGSAGSFTAS